jgi:hypothetical protein
VPKNESRLIVRGIDGHRRRIETRIEIAPIWARDFGKLIIFNKLIRGESHPASGCVSPRDPPKQNLASLKLKQDRITRDVNHSSLTDYFLGKKLFVRIQSPIAILRITWSN